MSVWTEPTECALCGAVGRDITYRLVEWVDALPGMRWAHVPRCDDRAACKSRVLEAGQPWRVIDSQRGKGAA